MEHLWVTASSKYPPENPESFLKISKKTPLKKSYFNNFAASIPETLQKAILTRMFSYKFLEFFRTTFHFVRLPLDGAYFFGKNASPK